MSDNTGGVLYPEAAASILRRPFDPGEVDKLPRRKKLSDGSYQTIMLDYVGHANVTDRLLQADPEWGWEPFAIDDLGLPQIVRRGDCLELWIRLTVGGITRVGVGSVPVECRKDTDDELPADQDTAKELIGDAIRNAAMRFGVALDLWRKHGADDGPPPQVVASGPPCPHCQTPVAHNADEATRGKRPVWSCPNRGCGGGGPRDKNDESKGRWPWGSYEANYFADRETGGEVEQPPLIGPAPAVPQDAFDDLTVNLVTLGISEAQARSELEAMRDNGRFAADHPKDIRARVNRACVLMVALGLEQEGIQGELWREWQSEDLDARRTLAWSTVRGREIPDFARHVQEHLRLRVV